MQSNRGLAFIAREEALVLVAFKDNGSDAIGYSHHGTDVVPGLTWTADQALAQMIADCRVVSIVLGRVITVPLPPTCWDALNSLGYHVGSGAIARSEIVTKINAGNLTGAAALFTTSGYEDVGRLMREAALFLTGDYTAEVGGTPLGRMLLYTSDPHASPKPVPQVVPFPLPL